jgi:hypothetical protein
MSSSSSVSKSNKMPAAKKDSKIVAPTPVVAAPVAAKAREGNVVLRVGLGHDRRWHSRHPGAGNGGKLEICVGDDFQFVMMDARGYETLGEMPLRNLSD